MVAGQQVLYAADYGGAVEGQMEYLIIAGGGSGGAHGGSGGGAGGYRSSVIGENMGGGAGAENTLSIAAGMTFTITVGGGGNAVINSNGQSGFNSSLVSSDYNIVSIGGAKGRASATDAGVGFDGGCGGGAAGNNVVAAGGAAVTSPVLHGHDGGSSAGGGYYQGGGGGCGQDGSVRIGGNGRASSITGASVTRGGGGGGSHQVKSQSLAGGLGGGGAGSGDSGSAAVAGTVNTGSGGGGHHHAHPLSSGAGGAGVVILRTNIQATGATGAPSTSGTADGSFVYFFSGNGTLSF